MCAHIWIYMHEYGSTWALAILNRFLVSERSCHAPWHLSFFFVPLTLQLWVKVICALYMCSALRLFLFAYLGENMAATLPNMLDIQQQAQGAHLIRKQFLVEEFV